MLSSLSSCSCCVLSLLSLLLLLTPSHGARDTPTSANCTELFFTQDVDHFNWGPLPTASPTYQQRYFLCDQYYKPGGPVFFYFGNEDDVTLYVNHTGLMWETAPQYGALLVFAEHRYYGKSLPFAPGTPHCMNWLTTEQAMADFAVLISFLKSNVTSSKPAWIGFGGSYGGMMAAWFRIKYPYLIDGVIAASAPIWSFLGLTPPYDSTAFYQVVTADASAAGGATDACKTNFRAALPRMVDAGSSPAGLQTLSRAFRTCQPLTSQADAWALAYWVQDPWATLAMGDFPYPSSYLLHGHGLLPAWPVRAACAPLAPAAFPDDAALFAAVREAVGVFYNYSHDVPCFFNGDQAGQMDSTPSSSFSSSSSSSSSSSPSSSSSSFSSSPSSFSSSSSSSSPRRTVLPRARMAARSAQRRAASTPAPATSGGPAACVGDWDYQWCTEMTQPFSSGMGKDMFYPPSPFDLPASTASCLDTWGVRPRPLWASVGLASSDLHAASNIVFSNGLLDPWHTGGVLRNISDTVVALIIPNGAHHLDLMFSDPADPPDVRSVRAAELVHIQTWISQRQQRMS